MAPMTQWKRLEGVVIARQVPGAAPFESGQVRYRYLASYVMGGIGTIEGSVFLTPVREYPDDSLLDKACEIGDPITVTIAPNGDVRTFVSTEVWAVDDC